MLNSERDGRVDREIRADGRVGGARRFGPSQLPAREDLFVDYSHVGTIDLPGLSLLFTAERIARSEHRRVWVAGLPLEFWNLLHAMGLDGFFQHFPEASDLREA